MSLAHRISIAAFLFLFFVPDVTSAATSATLTKQAQIAQIQQQIVQLQAELNAIQSVTVSVPTIVFGDPYAKFDLPFGQYITESGGGLRIAFSGLNQFSPSRAIAATSTLAQPFGIFTLNYGYCGGAYCQNPLYQTETTQLWPGQSTTYLGYNIMLNTLSTSTASFTVTKTSW